MKKRVFVLLLVLAMILAAVPVYTLAADEGINTEEELRDAFAAGGQVVLAGNVTLTENGEALTVESGKEVTLDLAGHSITQSQSNMNMSLIVNKGTLAIKDTVGGGKISYTYTGTADTTNSKGNYTVTNSGSLTLWSGTIEAAAKDVTGNFSHALYAIQNSTGGKVTIEGGKVYNPNNVAIRLFGAGDATVNSGEIEGTRAIWVQLPGSSTADAPAVNLTVTGGTLTGTGESGNNKLAIYSYSYGNDMKNVVLKISGGTFNGDIALTGGNNKTNIETVTVTGGVFNGKWGDLYSYGDDAKAKQAITVTGGSFADDPAFHVASGYVVTYKDGMYNVAEKAENVTLPEVDTAVSAGTSTGTVKEELKEQIPQTSVEAAVNNSTTKTDLQKAAYNLQNNTEVVGSRADAIEKLKEENPSITIEEDSEITVQVEPYLNMSVTNYETEENVGSTLTVEIDAKYDVVAYANDVSAVLDTADLEVNEPITIKVPLPAGFADVNTPVYVRHYKGGVAKYTYTATVTKEGETYFATFVNPNGFSTFEFSTMANFDGVNMLLEEDIDLVFWIKKEKLENITGAYATVVYHGEPVKIPMSAWLSGTVDEDAAYGIRFAGVAAKEMCDEVQITIYNEEEKAVTQTVSYTVGKAAVSLYNYSTEAKWKALSTALLNYGNAAQIAFDYQPNGLANQYLEQLNGANG